MLGSVTGRLIAQLMSDEAPNVDPLPYRPERYRVHAPSGPERQDRSELRITI